MAEHEEQQKEQNQQQEEQQEEQEETKSADELFADSIDAVLSGEGEEHEQTPGPGDKNEAPGEKEGKEGDEGKGKGGDDGEDGKSAKGTERKSGEDEKAPDYSVPEGLNERSSQRFATLVEDNKAQRELVKQQGEVISGMRQIVSDSGLTDKEYLGAIDFAATVKRDPKKGIEMMQGYIKHLARITGTKVEGMEIDLLEDFPDLRDKVEDMEMTEAAAIEIAQSRREKASREKADTERQNRDNQNRDYATARDKALKDVQEYLTSLSQSDIDWDTKVDLIVDAAAYARDNLHPTKWIKYLQQEVDKIGKIAKTVGSKRGKTPQPLTGGSHQRGGEKQPQTIEDAVNSVL